MKMAELDLIIQELYGISGFCDYASAPTTEGSESVTVGEDGGNHYITISAPFEGTATVSGRYWDEDDGSEFYYSLEISIIPTTYTVTLANGTEDDTNWTISPNPATKGKTVTITYNGTRKVKSVKAVKKAAASSITNPEVGQIIGSDGKNYNAGSLPTGVTAVAMIAYVSGSNGLAIALSNEMFNEKETMDWTTATTTAAAHTPAFAGCTWRLPSRDDWDNMFNANGGCSGLNDKLNTAGGNSSMLKNANDYWSSSVDVDNAYYMGILWDDADYYSVAKSYSACARAVFAFTCGEAAAARTLAEATTDDIGKIAGADGNIYDTKDDAEAVATGNAVAMIVYIGTTGVDTYSHGLALALTDEGTMNWATAGTTCSGKNTSTPVTGATWLLASKDQWNSMISAAGGYSALRTGFSSIGATDMEYGNYWSSTEVEEDSSKAWNYYFGGGSWGSSLNKTVSAVNVRACLAF